VPTRTRSLAVTLAFVAAAALVVGCGDDDGDTASTGTLAETTTTAAAETTTTKATATTVVSTTTAAPAGGAFAAGSPEAAAAEAYALVFDSDVPFAEKEAHLEDAATLEETIGMYTAGAAAFNGFTPDVTDVVVSGETAAVTYDLYFGTAKQYPDLPGTIENHDGTWTVTRAEFCTFMGMARVPCAAA
jgi:hypothetical protein